MQSAPLQVDALPLTARVVEELIGSEKPYLGAQLYVSHRGRTVTDVAAGEARSGVGMTPSTMVNWLCCTKVPTAVATLRLWEAGELDIDRPVAEAVPEFGARGKDEVTTRQLLTHTGGFVADPLTVNYFPRLMEWEAAVRIACEVPVMPGARPGRTTAYSVATSFVALGELIERITGSRVEEYVREQVFAPLGMDRCFFTLPPDALEDPAVADIYFTGLGYPVRVPVLNDGEYVEYCSPGATGRGPMNELGRLGEMLLRGGSLGDARVLGPQTAAAMTAVHRSDIPDEKFGDRVNWGLGLMADPWLFGVCCGPRTYGHKGFGASTLLVDPDEQLVIACFLNGMPKARTGVESHDRLVAGVYEDLGLVEPGTLESLDRARREGESVRPRDRFFQPMQTVNPSVAAWREAIGERSDEQLVALLEENGGVDTVIEGWFDAIAEAMTGAVARATTVAYVLDGPGGERTTYRIDLTPEAVRWAHADDPDAIGFRFEMTALDFVRVFGEALPVHVAFLSGRMRIHGDWSAMLQLPNVGETVALPLPVASAGAPPA